MKIFIALVFLACLTILVNSKCTTPTTTTTTTTTAFECNTQDISQTLAYVQDNIRNYHANVTFVAAILPSSLQIYGINITASIVSILNIGKYVAV